MASTLLSDAIEQYLAARVGLRARNTVANDRQTLTYFLTAVGNIQTSSLTARHGEVFMTYLADRKMQANTIRAHHSRMVFFVSWLKARNFIRHFEDPLGTVRTPRQVRKVRMRVPVDDFPRLLDAAHKPRGRIVVALGLYVFLRASEVKELRLDDVNLSENLLTVRQPKTEKEDEMPICAELADEIRRWVAWYSANTPRELRDSDFLVPSQVAPVVQDEETKRFVGVPGTLIPERPVRRPASMVQTALREAGYDTTDRWGKSMYEGVHTLRRSGARALFDHLADKGYDGAMRTVQAMLHHDHSRTTEIYLGLDLDIKKRNDLLRGEAMFGRQVAPVVLLEATL